MRVHHAPILETRQAEQPDPTKPPPKYKAGLVRPVVLLDDLLDWLERGDARAHDMATTLKAHRA